MEFIVDEFEDKNKQFEAKKALRKQYIKLLKTVKNPSKNAWNPFTKSKYADLSSVLEVIKQAQDDTDLAFFQDVSSNDGVITCYSYLIGMDGEIRFEPLTMPVQKSDPQSYASIETYARRYSAQSCTGIVAEADDDGNQSSYQSHQSNRNYGSRNYGNRNYGNRNYNNHSNPSYQSNNYQSNYQSGNQRQNRAAQGHANQSRGNQSSSNQNGSQTDSSNDAKSKVKLMGQVAKKISEKTGEDSKSIGNRALSLAGVTDKKHITRDQINKTIELLTKQLNESTENAQ